MMELDTRRINDREQAVVKETIEVPYDANDLQGRRREELVAMVQRQAEKWPYHDGKRRFTTKTNMEHMRSVLLNPVFGFTKEEVVVRPLSGPGTPGPSEAQRDEDRCAEGQDGWEMPGMQHGDENWGGRASPSGQGEEHREDEQSDVLGTVEVDVYVTIVSPGAEVRRNAFSIKVPQVGPVNALTYEWQADTQQLIERLAVQIPQLPGAMDVSYPDPVHPEYSRCLKAATAGLNIIDAPADVPTVHVPADNSLKLTISFHPGALPGPSSEPPKQPEPAAAVMGESNRVSPVVQWLTEAAQAQEGYIAFKQGQHHVQTNTDVVASWWFAVLFSERYSQTVSPVQPLDGRQRKRPKLIQKSEVQRALGVGSTWMSEATHAVALLRKYGECGVTPRQHVIDMCSDRTSKLGARQLLTKLREEEDQ